jgi:hypothetical protein
MDRSDVIRTAWFSVRHGGSLRPVLLGYLVFVVAAGVMLPLASTDLVQQLVVLMAMFLVFGLSRRLVSGDRIRGRGPILFQLPISPIRHYSAVAGIMATIILLGLVLSALVMAITMGLRGLPTQLVWGSLAGAVVWSAVVFPVGVGLSAVARNYDMELLLVLYFISAAQGVFLAEMAIPEIMSGGIVGILLPVEPIFLVWGGFVGQGWALTGWDLAHLVLYPSVWLVVAWVRLRTISQELD